MITREQERETAANPEEGPREHQLDVHGLNLSLVEWGHAVAPPVLCIHGWLDNAASYEPLAAHLTESRLLALELPGHGRSAHRPPGAAYYDVDYIRDIWAAADALGLKRVVLMGHSSGAGFAAMCAGTLPERVSRLILLEGLTPIAVADEDVPLALSAHLLDEASLEEERARQRRVPLPLAVRARMFGAPLSRYAAELLARRGCLPRADGVLWANDRRLHLRQPQQLSEGQIRAFLARIACPTLVIKATETIGLDSRLTDERLACISDVRVEELPGRHYVHMDDAPSVARRVRAFLREQPSPQSRPET